MEPVRTPRPWGNMTVPPLFGWEVLLTLLLVLVAVGVAFLLLGSTGTGREERSDWQAWLQSRSTGRPDLPGDEDDEPVGAAGPASARRAPPA